jgi:hypothetical protein
MSDKEIRLAIAEACGWEVEQFDFRTYALVSPSGKRWEQFDSAAIAWTANVIPDYCNDLNAMHEAEAWLKANRLTANPAMLDAWAAYGRNLKHTYSPGHTPSSHHNICPFDATARQRAEAFLRAIGEWRTP